jgi:sugar (pentulose or hexulose) kinase
VPAGRDLYIGIDIGTSGCRALAIDDHGQPLAGSQCPLPASVASGKRVEQQPDDWWQAVTTVLSGLSANVDLRRVAAIAVDGTSATLVLTDATGKPVTTGLMYDDTRAGEQAEALTKIAVPPTGAAGAGSSLAKLMWLHSHRLDSDAAFLQSQADWIAARLCGRFGYTDYNNALKLGYDAINRRWPEWIGRVPIRQALLPQVGAPGDRLGTITAENAEQLELNPDTVIRLGTTDSIAAFLASGATRPGQAVTSLGSTLVLKLLSEHPVYSPEHGVYSHRLGELWLVGGASNSGGGALLQHFSKAEMDVLTLVLQPEMPTGLDYYPLPATGERFPVNDPAMESRIDPVPDDRRLFFQAMLEGIANIEARGYRLLAQLGAPPLEQVLTSGGGAKNDAWRQIRERLLGVPVSNAGSTDAALGAARLAKGGQKKAASVAGGFFGHRTGR